MAVKITLAVGDHVRLPMRSLNEHATYQVTDNQVAPAREPVDGLVLSIRNISNGELVKSTRGDLRQYVFEIIYDRTFSSKFASLTNAPRGSERPQATPRWQRVRTLLREGAAQEQLYSSAQPTLMTESPLARFVDGWKIVKVRSKEIDSLEQQEKPHSAAE